MATLKDELASLKIDHSARAGGHRPAGKFVLAVLVGALLLGGGAWFWSQRVQAAAVKTATVTAASSSDATSGAVLNASGYVVARRRATVSSKVTGKVLELFVEEGQAVKRGQVLARLDDSQVRAGLEVARAQLAAAQGGFAEDEARLREAERQSARLTKLVQEKVVGQAEAETAQATVESLTARIALARQQVEVAQRMVRSQETDLRDMEVRAPFDGIAISKDAQPGEMISPVSAGGGFTRTGICTIVDMTSLEIEVDVSESYINRVKPEQPVEAVLDAYPDWRIPGSVITTVPTADRQKATVRVRIRFGPPTGPAPSRTASKGEPLDPARPAGHGRQGVVPPGAAGGSRQRARTAAAAGVEERRQDRQRPAGRVRRPRGSRRAARGQGRPRQRRAGRSGVWIEQWRPDCRRWLRRAGGRLAREGAVMDTLVKVRDLHKVYYRGSEQIDVLQGITLDIPSGDFLALMGPSGSGKTTLLNLIGGLDTPTRGTIDVAGDRIESLSGAKLASWRARHIGFVFQMYNLLPVLTAARNVELPLLLTKLGSADRRKRVQTALSVVGLGERANHYPRQLSGGQEQRVGIARAIVTDPTLLLCDEPTGDLDRKSGDEVLNLLQSLNRDHGKTIIMVTHDPRAAECARRTLHLEKGLLVEETVNA